MSIWVFQDSSHNNYVAYVNSTEVGVVKSNSETQQPIWSFQLEASGGKININGVVDSSGAVYIAYQDSSNTIIYMFKINSTGASVLWQQTVAGLITPSLSVDTTNLYLSAVNPTTGLITVLCFSQISGLNEWQSILPAGSSPSSVTVEGAVQELAVVQATGTAGGFIETRLLTTNGSQIRSNTYSTQNTYVPCFLMGALVLLSNCTWKRIEQVAAGDLLWTPHGPRPVVRRIESITQPSMNTYPCIIPKGFMGAHQTLGVSPSHKICMKDGTFQKAISLQVERLPMKSTWVYYNLELPEWEPICVGGLLVESFAPIKRLNLSRSLGCAFLSKNLSSLNLQNILKIAGRVTYLRETDTVTIPILSKKARRMYM